MAAVEGQIEPPSFLTLEFDADRSPGATLAALGASATARNANTNALMGYIFSEPLLNGSEEETKLAKQIEAGWYAAGILALRDPETREAAIAELNKGMVHRADVLEASRRPPKEKKHIRPVVTSRTQPLGEPKPAPGPAPYDSEIETPGGRERTLVELLLKAYRFNESQVADLEILVQEGDEAFTRFWRANLRLVLAVANHYRGKGLPLADLLQEGFIGLKRAVEKFDYKTGNKFSTYAPWWIREGINRTLQQFQLIRLPQHLAEDAWLVRRTSDILLSKLGQEPTPGQIVKELGGTLTEQRVRHVLRVVPEILYLEGPANNEPSALPLKAIIASKAGGQSTDHADSGANAGFSPELLAALPNTKGATYLKMHLGLPPFDCSHSIEEIADLYGITDSAVSSGISRALASTRAALGDKNPADLKYRPPTESPLSEAA